MAIRVIREIGDDILEKQCKAVPKMTLRTKILIGDMLETMYESNGVGLAAPQVGVLKRIVVIDVGEGPVVMVNPVILETSGEQTGDEGCLSIPGKAGQVTRPNYVKVHAFDENMEEIKESAMAQVDSNKKMVMVAENISKHFDEAMTMLNDLDESVAVSHSSIQEIADSTESTAEAIQKQAAMCVDIQGNTDNAESGIKGYDRCLTPD